ncbi:MAG: hypothetical protein HQL45_06200 [Alphaproteobacteria bacterium]|nr:hypothetical protein [Alphaproteobacteria bacterium]
MNALLEKAFAIASRLPESQQEAIASLVLEEIESERDWDTRLASTQDQLGELVRRAKAEVAQGDVLPFDPSDRPAT